ncbi:DNA-processing protein DprA [Streptomyces lannensis]|uniref:Smf/DprA SLOG domain-containing protein n=1 Tax=Streptomyces lannensis TaxID=766498 RepID=A0ABP7LS62_9ACTN
MPTSTLSDWAARAAPAAHFTQDQVAADLARYSPADVWQLRVRLDGSGRLGQYRPRAELDTAQLTCRFIIPSDEIWPTALADLGPRRPLGLWLRGGDQLPQLTSRAVTGNRNPYAGLRHRHSRSRPHRHRHARLQRRLRRHRAAAQAGHATLAVLPCGMDGAHPQDHAQLLSSLAASGGAVVSHCRPGTAASGATLKASSRLMAALARAVVLIETLDHAEATRTAESAIALNRPLHAEPANDDVRASGNARLLAEQLAVLVPYPAAALALL